jgi:Protein of unknown function (DUF3810)
MPPPTDRRTLELRKICRKTEVSAAQNRKPWKQVLTVKKYFLPAFICLSIAFRAFFRHNPDWTEKVYSRGIFQGVRYVLDYALGWLPFPLAYILFGWLFWRLAKGLRFLVAEKEIALSRRLLQSGRRLLLFLFGALALFYWLWGFNYYRIPLEQQLGLPPRVAITTDYLKTELEAQTNLLLALRTQLQPDSGQAIPEAFQTAQLETHVRQAVENQLKTLHFPTPGKVRGRQPFWPGFLLRFGAAGIYNPFTGECNTDQGLHFLTVPYNLAHEFCHGYGFGDEGVCNFLAYLALAQSDRPDLRYSAELDYWRELAGAYRRRLPEDYKTIWENLPAGFHDDLANIYKKMDQYPEYFEAFRYKVYDGYLKAQGVREGMQSYSKVVLLVKAYREKNE